MNTASTPLPPPPTKQKVYQRRLMLTLSIIGKIKLLFNINSYFDSKTLYLPAVFLLNQNTL